MLINISGLTYFVINSRNNPRAAVAAFMLHSDAVKFLAMLHSREGCHGDTYEVVRAYHDQIAIAA